ncbi:MAG: hypothetical protein Q9161_007769 [Pseudevernia consocians]
MGLDKDEWLVEYRGFGTDGEEGSDVSRQQTFHLGLEMFFISLKPVELSQIQASAEEFHEEFPRGGGDDSPRLLPQN